MIPLYRVLCKDIARMFALCSTIILTVIHALRNGDASARRMNLLCGKWAPSDDRFHDRDTVSALQQEFGSRVKDEGQTYDQLQKSSIYKHEFA